MHKLKRSGDTKFVDWYSDMIRMYSSIVYLLYIRMGCRTTVNHFTPLHLLSVWDLITRQDIRMPTKESYLNLITSMFNIWKVTSITPSKAEFRLLLNYSLVGLHWIRSSNVSSTGPRETQCRFFLTGAIRLNNGYYIVKFKNMQWWFQQSTKICMVGLIVLTGLSELLNRLIWCILNLLEQMLDWHIWYERMLHQMGSIAYAL